MELQPDLRSKDATSKTPNWARVLLCLFGLAPNLAWASGLDVQLKDLRHSYYFVFGTPKGESLNSQAKFPQIKECIKLTGSEVRKYGRLIHCHPEDNHVMCPLKSNEKLFAYESQEACNKALNTGVDQTPAD
jgi:hypothetical protein